MKRTKIVASLLMGSLVLTQGAFAQGFPGQGQQRPQGGQQGQQQGPQGGQQGQQQRPQNNQQGQRHDNGNSRNGPNGGGRPVADNRGPDRGPGAGPNHDMYRGGYVPRDYRSKQYVVNDWRAHRLSAPPRGYHWVQVGGDYVLAAVATGLIMQILLNN